VRNEVQGPADPARLGLYGLCHLLQEGQGGRVREAVHRPDVEGVDPVLPEPRHRALDEIPPDLVAAGTVEIESPVAAREVGAEGREGVPLDAGLEQLEGKHHGETPPVAGPDQTFQPGRPSRRGRNGKRKPPAGRRSDAEGGEPEGDGTVDAGTDRVEGAIAVVGFGEDGVPQFESTPAALLRDRTAIDDRGGPEGAERLESRGGVGPLDQPVEAVDIQITRPNAVEHGAVIPVTQLLQGDDAPPGRQDAQFHAFCGGCPDEKGASPPFPAGGTQRKPSFHARPLQPALPALRESRGPSLRKFTGSWTGARPGSGRFSAPPLLRRRFLLARPAAAALGDGAFRVRVEHPNDQREAGGEALELLFR